MAHQSDRGFFITDLCGHDSAGLEMYAEKCGGRLRFTKGYREVAANPIIDIEDLNMILMQLENGVQAQ